MSDTFAKILVSKNGGATASGGITCAFADSIQLSAQSTNGWRSALWEIYDFPPGFSLPSGWSLDPASGWYYFAPSNPTTLPPAFSIPASGANNWGPFALRLRINGNPLARNADGSPTVGFIQDLTDESTMLKVPSPILGLPGLAINETTQFDAIRSWVGSIMSMLRLLDFFGIGGASGQAPFVIDATSANISSGDCVAQIGGNKIIKASSTPLAVAGAGLGIAAAAGTPGQTIGVYVDTMAPNSVTGLGAGAVGPVRISAAGRCERVTSYSVGDCPIGTSDAAGNVTLVRGPIVGLAPTGSAGGALGGTYPNPTIALAANAGLTGVLDGSRVGTGGAIGGASMSASTIALGGNAALTGTLEVTKQVGPTGTGVVVTSSSTVLAAATLPINGANGVAGTDANSKVPLANVHNATIESKSVKNTATWGSTVDSFTTTSYVDSGFYLVTFASALAIGDIVEFWFQGFISNAGSTDGRWCVSVTDNGATTDEVAMIWDNSNAVTNQPVSGVGSYVVTAANAINTFKVAVRGKRISGAGSVNTMTQGALVAKVYRP